MEITCHFLQLKDKYPFVQGRRFVVNCLKGIHLTKLIVVKEEIDKMATNIAKKWLAMVSSIKINIKCLRIQENMVVNKG